MGSVVSINPGSWDADGHRLAAGVRVRQETDGLLFYQRKGPRLYFMGSGTHLTPEYFGSGSRLRTWLSYNGTRDGQVRRAVAGALRELVEKGVLIADPSGA